MVRAGDLFGGGVNIAARLQSIAKPGGVCISVATFDQGLRRHRAPHGVPPLGGVAYHWAQIPVLFCLREPCRGSMAGSSVMNLYTLECSARGTPSAANRSQAT